MRRGQPDRADKSKVRETKRVRRPGPRRYPRIRHDRSQPDPNPAERKWHRGGVHSLPATGRFRAEVRGRREMGREGSPTPQDLARALKWSSTATKTRARSQAAV